MPKTTPKTTKTTKAAPKKSVAAPAKRPRTKKPAAPHNCGNCGDSPNTTPLWVAMVLDESGSMESFRDQTIAGVNEYLQDRQRDADDREVKVWLTKFHSVHKVLEDGTPAKDVKLLDRTGYRPDAMTALYDATGDMIEKISKQEASSSVTPKILVVIFTDGAENASKRFNKPKIKEMIEAKEAKGNWTFAFVGSNQDSFLSAGSLGIQRGNTVNYKGVNTQSSLRSMSSSVSTYARSDGMTTSTLFGVTDL